MVSFRSNRGLVSYFKDACASNADGSAVVSDSKSLSFRDLDIQSDKVATHLAIQGVGSGDFVALLMHRSVETLVAMLGVIKTGAAYVPLDPNFTPEQLPFIAKDIPFAASLHASPYAELLPLFDLENSHPLDQVLAQSLDSPFKPHKACGDDAACVLYTSGTTGKPKGVVIPQRAISAYVLGLPIRQLDHSDVVLHNATIACDGALFEIWAGPLTGASTAVTEQPVPSLKDTARTMRQHGVTAILWYAGLHHLMIDHQINAFETVKLNLAGGDVMSPKHAQKLLDAWPDINLCNVYGPTETAIDSLWHAVTTNDLVGGAIPIGVPFLNEDAFIVDEDHNPLAEGGTGQLAVAGPGVALGYYNQPVKSAEVFLDDPRIDKHGKVFLTGDLVSQRPDGAFEFQGRVDRQIKLGGRRIELDGIEHVLRMQKGVSEAAVFVIDAPSGSKTIAAVLKPNTSVSADQSWIDTVLKAASTELNPGSLPKQIEISKDFPLTPAGKIDRKAVKAGFGAAQNQVEPDRASHDPANLKAAIAGIWGEILGCGPVREEQTFFDVGGTSLQLFEAHVKIEEMLGQTLDITLLFATPQLGALAQELSALTLITNQSSPAALAKTQKHTDADNDIAIVGLGGRFPGAKTLEAFYEKLRAGENLIPHFPASDLDDSFSDADRKSPDFVSARPILDDVDMFDAKFFNMLPREAQLMDPQARIFLEICVEALNNAGVDPKRTSDAIGVFAGTSMSTYMLSNLMTDRAALDDFTTNFQIGNYATLTGNVADSLSTRVAYKLDLKGPAITMGTACSTSLTAIAQACMNLRGGLADVALAGGVSVTFPQKRGYMSLEGGMGSRDGVCRPFDAEANGTVFGHGAGVVVLKRLSDAQNSGDTIYAVIRGVGLNNDGADKIAYTAPSATGQAKAIKLAHQDAGISADTVSYVECHGTATPLGDPIEIKGLSEAFGDVPENSCAIGSIKGNVGHLDAASGVVSVIKTALMLHKRELLPIANYKSPNPHINFAATPFFVPQNTQKWTSQSPRRAGISSFGVGGTNAHLLLEQAPETTVAVQNAKSTTQILPLSAKSPDALNQMADELAEHLNHIQDQTLADVALTLQDGRTEYPFRLSVPARDLKGASAALQKARAPRAPTAEGKRPVVFMFPGQGSQYPGMGKDLYSSEPEFARWIDQGAKILEPILGLNINEILCLGDVSDSEAAQALKDTRLTQPALYLVQYACARLWMSRGITPDALIGHSVGEFAAAALSGVFSFEDGLRIIAARGQLMQDQPAGSMLSVRTDIETLRPYISECIDLAAQNAPKLQVLAGPATEIDVLATRLEADGLPCSILHTSHAFHSAMMDPVLEPLNKVVEACTLGSPRIPYVSCVTGNWITDAEARDPSYWAGQARAAVNFQAAVTVASGMGSPVLLEVGAGRALSAFAAQTLERGSHGGIFQSLPDHTQNLDDEISMAAAFGNLWSAGVPLNWDQFGPRGNKRVPLPTYAFQRKRHWVEAPAKTRAGLQDQVLADTTPTTSASAPVAHAQPNPEDRKDRLLIEVLALFSDLSGEDLTSDDAVTAYLELGFDSLFLGQVSQALMKTYGLEVSFRNLMTDYPNMASLVAKLDTDLPADQLQDSVPGAPVQPPITSALAQVPEGLVVELNDAEKTDPDFVALAETRLKSLQAVFAQQLSALRESKKMFATTSLDAESDAPFLQAESAAHQTKNLPLTANQKELWTTSQIGDMASCCFNQSASVRLDGDLQVSSLQTAITKLISRHDGLRMVFNEDGETFDIASPFPSNLEHSDLSTQADPEVALAATVDQMSRQVFEIDTVPSLWTKLVKLGPKRHVLVFNTHHIVCDGWSYNIVFDELAKLYTEDVTGVAANLPAAASFAQFALEQSAKTPTERTRKFWAEQFGNAPDVLDLPADTPRPEHRSFEAGYHSAFIGEDAAIEIRRSGARNGCTLFATLFAGLQITLGRLGDSDDVVIGIPTAGQTLLNNSCLIGHYVNFLPIRAPFADGQTVSGHMAAAQNALLNAFDHKDYTYGTLVSDLGLQSTPGRLPLTEVELNLEREAEVLDMAGLKVSTIFNPKPSTNFDMFINVTEIGQRLRIDVTYNSEIYRGPRIDAWMESFKAVLIQFAIKGADRLDQLDVPAATPKAEHVSYSTIDTSVPVTNLVAQNIAAYSQKCAVGSGADHLTYAELDARSDAIAAVIQQSLPEKGTRIAVALPRSTDLLASILGILKSGNAFVPLDPRQPPARLRTILETAEAGLLLAENQQLVTSLELPTLPVLFSLDIPKGQRPAAVSVSPEDTAYVIFTSGTTGTPKGVEIQHQALSNFLQSMAIQPGFTSDDVLLSVTTVMFDISILELFLPLICGGKVELARTEDVLDGFAIVERLEKGDVTVVQATPTLWTMLLDAGLQPCPTLKVLVGGEPLPSDLARQLHQNAGSVWNMYGPTETTIWSSVKQITAGDDITVGQPIANTEMLVLDDDGNPVSEGDTGDLMIGGEGLAKGYYGRPNLTEEAFQTLSFDQGQKRFYRTGDLARKLPSGEIEVLGRKDSQVKLRGFRIELGDIECKLRALPGVGKAAVSLWQSSQGDKQLVAYVVPESGLRFDPKLAKEQLAIQLPDYMVPQSFVELSALPQTANGKLDRKSLPDPQAKATVSRFPDIAQPGIGASETITDIWCSVLEIETIDPDANLFALGAESLHILRIVAAMETAGLDITVNDVLAQPTIRTLASSAGRAASNILKPETPQELYLARRSNRSVL